MEDVDAAISDVDTSISSKAEMSYVDNVANDLAVLSSSLSSYALTSDVPTKTSELTNDSGFVTQTEVDTALALKQDKLTDAQISAIDTPHLPLTFQNAALSGSYLDFNCTPRFNR